VFCYFAPETDINMPLCTIAMPLTWRVQDVAAQYTG